MRAYILSDDDFARLLAEIDRDPRLGTRGGSSVILSKEEREAYDAARSFYNFQLRTWISKMTAGSDGAK